ncbi:MAG: acyl-CoA dehydrogenase family protein, partial [Acidimicrobiia bacterium]|nr:acyl-CoA dehydrogenase family protein [Acidimicrobiia bacterium]
MDFAHSERSREWQDKLNRFMAEHVYPAEAEHELQRDESGPEATPVLRRLQTEARAQGLWNLFLPGSEWGAGLKNVEYAPLAEIMGRSIELAPEAANCSAPDTGNMEVLADFGTDEQKQRWLVPLLNGEIRSCFAMTEPAVASSDPRNLEASARRVGDEYVINGTKWWTTGALSSDCRIAIFMGVTNPEAPPKARYSMILVPMDTPGVEVERDLSVFGFHERGGHGEVSFTDVRVPAANVIAGEGDGYMIAQARLGPGRIHHCMRSIGQCEVALELMAERAVERVAFGKALHEHANVADWIAESRAEIEQARLLVLKTAWMIDQHGSRAARNEISMIKYVVPPMQTRIMDRAMQIFGAAGLTPDTPLSALWTWGRALRFADGPDEVHKRSVARREV